MKEENLQEVINRVKSFEHSFDLLKNAYRLNPEAVCNDLYFEENLQKLKEYYEGGQWLSDYEMDEKGLLPKDLKRGVLSQDEVYDFLTEVDKNRMRRDDVKVAAYSNNLKEYLNITDVVNYDHEAICRLAEELFQKAEDEIDYIKIAYEYIRDQISHSADISEDVITCAASEVLEKRHGICFAKSNLLAALLRYKGIPTGFCYQKLILDDDTAPVLIYHGLNGVYIEALDKWIRIDARGNKEGVNAQFSLEKEQLAFPIREEKGEEDDFYVYPSPDANVLECLKSSVTRSEMWEHLPTKLAYLK